MLPRTASTPESGTLGEGSATRVVGATFAPCYPTNVRDMIEDQPESTDDVRDVNLASAGTAAPESSGRESGTLTSTPSRRSLSDRILPKPFDIYRIKKKLSRLNHCSNKVKGGHF